MTTKTITLCDGFEVTFRRRGWDEFNTSTLDYMDALAELEKADMTEAARQARLVRLDSEFREKPMKLYVQDWDSVRGRISVAGMNQLEEAMREFSRTALVEKN